MGSLIHENFSFTNREEQMPLARTDSLWLVLKVARLASSSARPAQAG
jgi:hypothetical protein